MRKALITKVNKPSVNRLIGKVSSTRIGFKIAFITPSTNAVQRAVVNAETCTPGNNFAAKRMTIALTNQVANNSSIFVW